jgi:hypothetical protein
MGTLAEWDKTVVEEPLGEKRTDYHEKARAGKARGERR